MPIYEYRCNDCGHQMEAMQSMRDDPLTDCPSCDGSLRKLMSAAGIILKGSGWYTTDYARAGTNGASAGSDAGGSDAKGSGGSDAKGAGGSSGSTGGTSSGDTSSGDSGGSAGE